MTLETWRAWPAKLAARRWPGLGAAALSGLVAALGQAPFDLMPATIFGLAAGIAIVASASGWKRAAILGWGLGAGYFTLALVWILQPFFVEPEVYGWMAPFGLFFMAGGMALFWGGAAAIGAALLRGPWRWATLALSLGLMEWVRGWIFTGFPWGGPGLVWIDHPPAQVAAIIGVYGLNVLTFLLAAALWPALGERRSTMGWVIGLFALWGVGAGLEARDLPEPDAPRVVRLVQPNADQKRKWDPDWVWTFFDRAIALTETPADGDAPALVIWPETSVPTGLGRSPEVEMQVAQAAAPAPIVAGIQRREGVTYRNALVAYDGGIDPVWVYDKHHLVPFGEYVPLGNLAGRLGIRGLAQQEGAGYAPGPGPEVLPLPRGVGNILPLICYEAVFPRDIRGAPVRPDWLLQATNDAWFGTFSGPQQHLVQARFRAVEFGLPLARAANTGISAMIDPKGQITAQIPLGEAGVIDAVLPTALPPTIYAKTGDWPMVALVLIGLAGFAVAGRRKPVDPGQTAL